MNVFSQYGPTEISLTTTGSFSDFVLYPSQTEGRGTLSVALDGEFVDENGISVFMQRDVLMKKEVVIIRGPDAYQDAPVFITLQSKCE